MQASFSGADWDVVGLAQPFYWIPSYVGDQPTFYRVHFLANSSTQWSYIGKHEWHCCANKRWLSAVRCMIIAPENNSRRWSYDRLKIEFHRELFSWEAAPTAPNTIETEGKQCPFLTKAIVNPNSSIWMWIGLPIAWGQSGSDVFSLIL